MNYAPCKNQKIKISKIVKKSIFYLANPFGYEDSLNDVSCNVFRLQIIKGIFYLYETYGKSPVKSQ